LQGRILPLVNKANNLFQQLDFPRADQWVGTLYAVLAHAAGSGGARVQYAEKAWRLLEPPLSLVSEELRVYVQRLAGLGDGKIVEPGVLGTRWRSHSRDAFFSIQDLYLFSDM
jgi:hypothetical protein